MAQQEQRDFSISFRDSPTVELLVGQAQVAFQVHRNLLCSVSPFFEAAFMKEFKEAAEQSISLPDDDVDAVENFIYWVYFRTHKLPSVFDTIKLATDGYLSLAKLYILADKLQVDTLKKYIVRDMFLRFRQAGGEPPQPNAASYAYENSTEKCALRKLMVAWYTWAIGFEYYSKSSTAAELAAIPEFAGDLAVSLGKRLANPGLRSPLWGEPEACYEPE